MIDTILAKIFGTKHEREIKKIRPLVSAINALEPQFQQLSDEALRAKTAEFKERVAKGETLDQILPEAFATVREAGRRVLNMRHFDVQLVGGMVLHDGKIAEMRTGEGKTLVATLPSYLNALTGKGVHVITVNDYLTGRDAREMAPLYEMLGLSVGAVIHELNPVARRSAYGCDVTYCCNKELAFDYLRDRLVVGRQPNRIQLQLEQLYGDAARVRQFARQASSQ
mgnify:CR=1 FL=1